MEAITLILATAAVAASLTWFLAQWRQTLSPTHGALAPVWREGYVAGVADQDYAAAIDLTIDGYWIGPNRANPYRGSEKQATNA
ncbi:MAG TPA: hypothetical protein VF885_09295 [Arthrobacter sp.]